MYSVLLPSVKEEDQINVLYTLLHAFSLQLPCRRVLYAQLTRLLQSIKEKNRERKEVAVRNNSSTANCSESSIEEENGRGIENEEECAPADENESNSSDCSKPRLYLSPQVISTLFKKVSTRLSSFLITASNALQKEDPGPTFQSHSSSNNRHSMYNSRGRRVQSEDDCASSRTIVCTKNCILFFRTLRGYKFSLAEDLPLLMELSYALAEHSSNVEREEHSSQEEEIVSDVIYVAGVISQPGKILPKSRKSVDLSFRDLTRSNDGDLGSFDSRNFEEDLGPTGSFLLALLNFISAGFPLPVLTHKHPDKRDGADLGSDSRIAALNGRSINMDVPLGGVAIAVGNSSVSSEHTDCSAYVTYSSARVTAEDEEMKEEEHCQLLITHFACCYGLLGGMLICLTRTLSSVSSSLSAAEEEREGEEESDRVSLDAVGGGYKCSDGYRPSSATISCESTPLLSHH